MLSRKSDGNIACCYDSFELHPIVAIYGLLWYTNSIYGVVLMIVESQNICFFEWYPVCVVNAMIPILWLIIIAMVDSCCVKYWSLKKWHRRHYGAAFLYFAIFTNQTLIFGTLCVYGFDVWSTVSSDACNTSNHLRYGFIIMICTSTLLILWIGLTQFYAATKYLCTYTAVLEVKKRQQSSNQHLRTKTKNGGNASNISNGSNTNARKMSVESRSMASEVNMSRMSFSFIRSIYRYGSEPELVEDGLEIENDQHFDLKLSDHYSNEFDHTERHQQQTKEHEFEGLTPFPSERGESAQLMEYINDGKNNHNKDTCTDIQLQINEIEINKISESRSQSPSPRSLSPSVSHTQSHIEIAGISIAYRRKFSLTPINRKHHNHKEYKSVKHKLPSNELSDTKTMKIIISDEEEDEDNDDRDEHGHHKNVQNIENNHKNHKKQNNENEENDVDEDDERKKPNHLFSVPLFGTAIKMTSNYFARLKEDPSTADLCIICYDSFKEHDILARLKCEHVYHKNCIRIWLANNHQCPLCNMNEKNLNLKINIPKIT